MGRVATTIMWFGAVLLAALATVDAAGDDGERWYAITLDGTAAGWVREARRTEDGAIVVESETMMHLVRSGDVTSIHVQWRSRETADGAPIEIRSERDLSDQATLTTWRFDDDGVDETVTQGSRTRTRRRPLPEGAWLMPAAADRHVTARLAAGDETIRWRALDPESGLDPVAYSARRTGRAVVESLGEPVETTIWTLTDDTSPLETTQWLDAEGGLVQQAMALGFGRFMLTRSTRDAVMSVPPFEAPEIMVPTFVAVDRGPPGGMDSRRATWRLRRGAGPMPDLPAVGCQRVERGDDGTLLVTLDLDDVAAAPEADATDPRYREPSAAVECDDPLVVKLTERVLRRVDGDDPTARALALRAFVGRHIIRKSYRTAFASAAETARTRGGDCSEHGVLLCAMLRAAGIPARVATGLVWMEGAGDTGHALGWHMWTQALLDGKWIDLDATLPVPYHAGHVLTGTSALDDSSGNREFSEVTALIGDLSVTLVAPEPAEAAP